MLQETYCKSGINPEGFTRKVLNPSPSVATTKENMQQNLKGTFANRHSFNKRRFKRGKMQILSPCGRRLGYLDQNQAGNVSKIMIQIKIVVITIIIGITEVMAEVVLPTKILDLHITDITVSMTELQ